MRMRYDVVYSVGLNCASAAQIECRGLRAESGPVDWITPISSRPSMDLFKHWIKTDFSDALKSTNPDPVYLEDVMGFVRLKDNTDTYFVPHDYKSSEPSMDEQRFVHEKYKRRGMRFNERLRNGEKVLLVLNAETESFDQGQALNFLTWIRSKFPNAKIDMFAVFFSSPAPHPVREIENGFYVHNVPYPMSFRREFKPSSQAFAFLDDVELANHDRRALMVRTELLHRKQDEIIFRGVSKAKKYNRAEFKEYRYKIRNATMRGLCRFRHVSPLWRFLFFLAIRLRKPFFLNLIPDVKGVTMPA